MKARSTAAKKRAMSGDAATDTAASDIAALKALEKKVLWLSSWMIHNANHLRESSDKLKVGGHQASSASLVTAMTALYLLGAPA